MAESAPMEVEVTPEGELGENVQNIQRMTAIEIQQEYYENLMDCDWVKYERQNRNFLIQNVAFALFGSPTSEGELVQNAPAPEKVSASDNAATTSESVANAHANGSGDTNMGAERLQEVHLQGYTSRQQEQVMKIYEKLCEQGKYSLNDEDILLSVLLIVCCKPRPMKFYQIEPTNYWWDLQNKTDVVIWCTAVFRVRKCIPSFDGARSCRLYIDEDARVYHTWEAYLENNTLPKCVLVVPENGEYRGTLVEERKLLAVNLSVIPSPALGLKARVLTTADTTSTVASIGTIGVLAAAMFTPVAPVVLAGATVATVATGVYGLVRSSLHLHDRRIHDQPISPTNAEARGSWINIAASSVGVTAGAATSLLSKSAAAGTNMTKTGLILETSVDVLRHANIVTGGVGLANSLVHFIIRYHKHGETPSSLELFQFTASTLFFANAVMSNRTAKSIIEEAQTKTINDYRDTLRSNRHRRMFDKVSAETRRVEGPVSGNTEVIRSIRNIANKDQYFADVLRINKDLNAQKIAISMTADGLVNLNARHVFDPSELARLSSGSRMELFSSLGASELTAGKVATRLYSPTTVGRYVGLEEEHDIRSTIMKVSPGEVIRIGGMLLRITSSGVENIADLLHDVTKDLHSALMTISMNVLASMLPAQIAKLRLLSPEKDLIAQVVEFVFNYMKRERPLGDPCMRSDNGIIVIMKEFFQDGHVKRDSIMFLVERFSVYINEKMEERRQLYPNKREIVCNECNGIRYA